jgi:hypothetical protein
MRIRGDSPFREAGGESSGAAGSRAEQGKSTGHRTELISGLEKSGAESADEYLCAEFSVPG